MRSRVAVKEEDERGAVKEEDERGTVKEEDERRAGSATGDNAQQTPTAPPSGANKRPDAAPASPQTRRTAPDPRWVKFDADQAALANFPHGCPVWHGFGTAPGSNGGGARRGGRGAPVAADVVLSAGIAASVHLDIASTAFYYGVAAASSTADENDGVVFVPESDMAYAAGCPVRMTVDGNPIRSEGEVLNCESRADGTYAYTVAWNVGGNRLMVEAGVGSDRLEYHPAAEDRPPSKAVAAEGRGGPFRSDEAAAVATAADSRASISKSPSIDSRERVVAAVASSRPGGRKGDEQKRNGVPSVVACETFDSSANGICGRGGESKADVVVGIERGVNFTAMNADRLHPPPEQSLSRKRSFESQSFQGSGRDSYGVSRLRSNDGRDEESFARIPRKTLRNESTGSGRPRSDCRVTEDAGDEVSRILEVPWWLQQKACKQDLFCHLIGVGGQRTKRIGSESRCRIQIRGHDNVEGSDTSMHVKITSKAYKTMTEAMENLNMAKEKMEESLLDFVKDDASKGKLFYDLAVSSSGSHRPYRPIDRAVRQRNPNDSLRAAWMSVVDLPSIEYSHGAFLLTSKVPKKIRDETGCKTLLCGDDFGVPLRLCDPYVMVSGRTPALVDDAVEILKDAIRQHQIRCPCSPRY